MKKRDWYIFKKLISTFFFCMMLFTVIAVAIDSSEKTDDFVKTGLSTSTIITDYYFGFVPFIWGLLFPLFVFIGCIYFTSRMATRSEIVSILASGTSFNRYLRAYIIGGILLGDRFRRKRPNQFVHGGTASVRIRPTIVMVGDWLFVVPPSGGTSRTA